MMRSLIKKPFLYLFLASATVFTTSCTTDDDDASAFERGVFVTNEGQFSTPTAEVSFISRDGKNVVPDLFSKVNNRPLGDAAQSMLFVGNKAYIAVNASEKIEVVDASTFASLGVINGLKIPRYMAALNDAKAYVTEYVDYGQPGRVSVLNLNENTVTKTIEVGQLPEGLLLFNGKLYVANSGENTISVINTATDRLETTITVGDAPNRLVLDANNMIWVLRGGYGSSGALVKINPANNALTNYTFPGETNEPGQLAINGAKNMLYYSYNGKVYSMATTAAALPTTAVINRNPYGLGVDPENGTVYLGVGGFTSNGWAVRYQPSGALIDSMQVRIAPNGFTFR